MLITTKSNQVYQQRDYVRMQPINLKLLTHIRQADKMDTFLLV